MNTPVIFQEQQTPYVLEQRCIHFGHLLVDREQIETVLFPTYAAEQREEGSPLASTPLETFSVQSVCSSAADGSVDKNGYYSVI